MGMATTFSCFFSIIMGHFSLTFAHPTQVKLSMCERAGHMQTF